MRACSLLLLLALAAAAPLAAQSPVQTTPIDTTNIDRSCKACDDFFTFANGGWISRATIPADQARWGSFNELYERNLLALREMLEASAAAGAGADPNARKLGVFYASCTDSLAIERAGTRPIAADLAAVAAIRARADLQGTLAGLQRRGVTSIFTFGAEQDDKRSDRVIATLGQGGLSLPDRDYYLRSDSGSVTLRAKYADHIVKMLRLLGDDSSSAAKQADRIVQFETTLARAAMTATQRRNSDSTYHLTTLAQLQTSTPAIAWTRYLGTLGVPAVTTLNVRQPVFVHTVDSLVANAPLDSWKPYLRWRVLNGAAARLNSPFVNEDFAFKGTVLSGVSEMRPRWKRCVQATDGSIGEILGQQYVKTRFTPEAKGRALTMVRNIQAEFRSRLGQLTWMSATTRSRAEAKLDAIVNKIGYPDRWRDYSALEIRPADYAGNVARGVAFELRRDRAKIGRPVDRAEWNMTPPTVNAQYSATMNDISFPAGILQPPFFDPNADDAVNYGGMGAVIGHEITHGFDDEGHKYDAKGNLSGWWSSEDEKAFNERAQVVADQFSGYVAVDTLHLNGKLTLGENIADFGGLTIAYGAYKRSLQGKPEPAPIDGFTGDQRFFLAWAQIWRETTRKEYARMLVTVDPHSPGKYRVNGPLANMPEFAAAFSCQQGDKMIRNATERAEIW